jgi:hypothetical protein
VFVGDDDIGYDDEYVFAVQGSIGQRNKVTVVIEDADVGGMIDSGASVNILDRTSYDKICIYKQVVRVYVWLQERSGYSGPFLWMCPTRDNRRDCKVPCGEVNEHC